MDLRSILVDSGIDLSKWGTGRAKTLSQLEKEVFFGETRLLKDVDGKLIRRIRICNAQIYYTNQDGVIYILRQAEQVLPDGRKRMRQFENSLSEKCQFDETPGDTIVRGLLEELTITNLLSIILVDERIEVVEPDSYPGLVTEYTIYEYKIELSSNEYKSEGYSKNERGLINTFFWKKLS